MGDLAAHLKDDPASIEASFSGWGTTATFRRSFPTNWVPPSQAPAVHVITRTNAP